MINQDKITASKVAQRLSGRSDGDIIRPKSIPNFNGGQTQFRIYEIENTDDAGKLYFSSHHLRNALYRILRQIELINLPNPTVVLGGNNMLDFKCMSKGFKEDIETRITPALIGLREFSSPHNEAALAYQKIIKSYEKKVAAVELIYQAGNKRYSRSYTALAPHFKKMLSDLSVFTKKAIADYS